MKNTIRTYSCFSGPWRLCPSCVHAPRQVLQRPALTANLSLQIGLISHSAKGLELVWACPPQAPSPSPIRSQYQHTHTHTQGHTFTSFKTKAKKQHQNKTKTAETLHDFEGRLQQTAWHSLKKTFTVRVRRARFEEARFRFNWFNHSVALIMKRIRFFFSVFWKKT